MSQLRVLIVDDEPSIRAMIADGLRKTGYQTDTADSGPAALQLAQDSVFDLVLLDIHLQSGMYGIAVLEALKRQDPVIDVVLMTGYPEVSTAVQALRLGAHDYLIKPLNWEALRHLVR